MISAENLPQLVLIEWVDTTNIAAWTPIDEIAEWAVDGGWLCNSIGYLVHEDDDCVVLAARLAFWAAPRQAGLYERIPKGTIRARWTLPDPREPQRPEGCEPDCNGTWPAGPDEPCRPFHVRGCPNDPTQA